MRFEIVYFLTQESRCPVLDFIREQEVKHRATILRHIERLAEMGPSLPGKFTKYLKGSDGDL